MSVVRVDVRDDRPTAFACVNSRGHSFNLICLKLGIMLIFIKLMSISKLSHVGS